MDKRNIGSTFDSLLEEMGVRTEAQLLAQKKGIVRTLREQLRRQHVSKAALAKRMGTSRPQVDRLFDPENTSVTLDTLGRVAAALDLQLEVRFGTRRGAAAR